MTCLKRKGLQARPADRRIRRSLPGNKRFSDGRLKTWRIRAIAPGHALPEADAVLVVGSFVRFRRWPGARLRGRAVLAAEPGEYKSYLDLAGTASAESADLPEPVLLVEL